LLNGRLDNHLPGYNELKALQQALKANPGLAPSTEQAKLARQIAQDKLAGEFGRVADDAPVLQSRNRWIVLVDHGHPYADGAYAVVVIDSGSHQILKAVGIDGGRRQEMPRPVSQPTTSPAVAPAGST
jgi:hypothetical protein